MVRRLVAGALGLLACAQVAAAPIAQQVVARNLPPGWYHTVGKVAPTVHYFVNEASFTFLGGRSTFTADWTTATPPYFTLKSVPVGNFQIGQVLYFDHPDQFSYYDGVRIVGVKTTSPLSCATTPAIGCEYMVGTVPANAATNVSMISDGTDVVLGMSDLRGNYPLTSSVGNATTTYTSSNTWSAPRLITDQCGRKALQFESVGGVQSLGSFMQAAVPNIDTHNVTWLFAGRTHSHDGGAIVSFGNSGTSGSPNASAVGMALGTPGEGYKSSTGDGPYVAGIAAFVDKGAGSSRADNANRMMGGAEMEVVGLASASTDGLNASTSTGFWASFLNETTAKYGANLYTTGSVTRTRNITGIELGRISGSTGPTNGNFGKFMLYELKGWTQGELGAVGTDTYVNNTLANARAEADAMVANFKVPAITDRVVIVGDSRTQVSAYTNNLATYLTEPCSPTALPASTNVVSLDTGGANIEHAWPAMYNSSKSVFSSTNMINSSGGHDTAVLLSGVNDEGTAFPAITAAHSPARGDEVYNGTDLDSSFHGYISGTWGTSGTSGNKLTITDTPTVSLVSTITYPSGVNNPIPMNASGIVDGTSVISCSTETQCTLNLSYSSSNGYPNGWGSAASPIAFTTTFASVYRRASLLLGRNWKVITIAEQGSGGFSAGTTQYTLRNHILSDLQTALGNNPNHQVMDAQAITVGGLKILGADGNTNNYKCFMDALHPSAWCRNMYMTGGDTPQYGLRALLTPH